LQQDRTPYADRPRQPSPYERAGSAEINAIVERIAPAQAATAPGWTGSSTVGTAASPRWRWSSWRAWRATA